MLVPEIALDPAARRAVPRALRRAARGAALRTDATTSGCTRGARARGEAPRRHRHALGGVRAAGAPGLIVVDEEHDASYKQQDGFRYSARDLALCARSGSAIPVVLGSATPSLESLAARRAGRATQLDLPERAAGARPPRRALVDMRKHAATQGIATPTVLAAIRGTSTPAGRCWCS